MSRVGTRPYRVEFSRSADRQFRALPVDVRRRIAPRITALAGAPRPKGVEKLKGADDLYRLHVGDYRIVYEIRARVLLILVLRVAHRRATRL